MWYWFKDNPKNGIGGGGAGGVYKRAVFIIEIIVFSSSFQISTFQEIEEPEREPWLVCHSPKICTNGFTE